MTDRPGEPSLLDDLERHVRRAHWTDAARALQSFVAAHESVHDGYRDVVARILTRILEQFGTDAVEQLSRDDGLVGDHEDVGVPRIGLTGDDDVPDRRGRLEVAGLAAGQARPPGVEAMLGKDRPKLRRDAQRHLSLRGALPASLGEREPVRRR